MKNSPLKIVIALLLMTLMMSSCNLASDTSVAGLGVVIFICALLVIAGIVIILRLGKRKN